MKIIDPTKYTQRDYYLNNPLIKNIRALTHFTPEMIEEYKRCSQSCEYFCENYVKILSLDEGMVNFIPYPYQRKMWKTFEENRFTIVLAARQSGKSIGVLGFILWFALFRSDENIAIVAHKGAQARELLSRITLSLENIPFFLQPGCKTLNKGRIEFGNNTTIFAEATTSASLRGRSVSFLYIDEHAFIENDEEFMTSTYPVISSGENSKIIITSSANGIGNSFYFMWKKAIQGKNLFVPIEVKWNDVPGRDEKWKEETIANTSQKQFDQEFDNQFHSTRGTLISSSSLSILEEQDPIEIIDDRIFIYEEPDENSRYCVTVDVSKGVGGDFSTFTIFNIDTMNQACVFRDNSISPYVFPMIISSYASKFNDAYVIVENNDIGVIVASELYFTLEYENTYVNSMKDEESSVGIHVNHRVKKKGCLILKDLIENQILKINDKQTIMELSTFIEKGKSYEAKSGNTDDLVSNLWLFAWFTSTNEFIDLQKNRQMTVRDRIAKSYEEKLVPFGIIDGGFRDPNIKSYSSLEEFLNE